MRGFIGLTKRNLLIYFKDISAVIFSLLTSIIVFVLYLVFLKGTFVDTIENAAKGLENYIAAENIDTMVSMLLLVGIVGSAMITVSYSCLSTVIKDRENKVDYDICATPISRGQIILSYFVSAVLSAFLVTGLVLTIGLVILSWNGELSMTVGKIAQSYGIVIIGCVSATAIFMIMALFFKSSASSSAFFGILSAASGFVIGAYIPLSQFSETIQTLCNLFPATQVTVMLRNNLMSGILEKINEGIGGVDQGAFVEGIRTTFNFEATLWGRSLDWGQMLLYVFAVFAISIVGLVVMYTKTYKRQ